MYPRISAEQRLSVRKAMAALRARLDRMRSRPSSPLGKAIDDTLAHWHALIAFLEDGWTEVDRNVVERALKPVCLTRKNRRIASLQDPLVVARHGRC
ncbi:hypothetical protein SAMCFNEI73_pB0153 (plasmid) [Sinorhizobium americanum]|uniref:Transposase IS66 central domain-containing protein n=2 Tax=Sinorhizobium americanum TaxID=194963 RepID=A0A1L3LTG4_9HYPH|nr:hypothetical protein SAMCFNEI73_pB0153 [Sinorhizobium americanum]OAP38630.1 hypothetical protein ATC00_12045 [Sinorhizobium americanum]